MSNMDDLASVETDAMERGDYFGSLYDSPEIRKPKSDAAKKFAAKVRQYQKQGMLPSEAVEAASKEWQ